jgi:hypothetical protein
MPKICMARATLVGSESGTCPSRSRVVALSRALRAAIRATSAWCRTRRASSSSAVPASVRETLRCVRLNSRTPSSSSSLRTCSLTAGCATCRRSAARRKCSSSATATKYLKCRSSIQAPSFDGWGGRVDCARTEPGCRRTHGHTSRCRRRRMRAARLLPRRTADLIPVPPPPPEAYQRRRGSPRKPSGGLLHAVGEAPQARSGRPAHDRIGEYRPAHDPSLRLAGAVRERPPRSRDQRCRSRRAGRSADRTFRLKAAPTGGAFPASRPQRGYPCTTSGSG